jgi:dTDP-glucose pyrophosphorylase
MLTLVLPVCGKSSRFPNLRPKWLLTHATGKSMLQESISGLDLTGVDRIVAIALKEHEEQYGFSSGIIRDINDERFEFCFLDTPTDNQPQTIAEGIKKADIKGAFVCKDSDNYFQSKLSTGNYVGAIDLRQVGHINAGNKSYITMSATGSVNNIVEKDVISNHFCCGLYGFESAKQYLKYYDKISSNRDIYVSHVIHSMLLDGMHFSVQKGRDFIDWGTLEDWNKYRDQFMTIFCDIDGVIVETSSSYMKPYLGTTDGIEDNIKVINELYNAPRAMVIMTTARPESSRELTEQQLERVGLKYDKLIMGLPHAKRIVINDFAASNIYPSCSAINLHRDTEKLREFIN